MNPDPNSPSAPPAEPAADSGQALPDGRPMPGGYDQFDAADLPEALALAERFKAAGRYRYFRGQRDASWKMRPTLARLTQVEREAETEKFATFYGWAKSCPDLFPYLTDDDHLIAAAQHHGISATPFIDFTTEPAVAAWFATAEAKPGDHGAILMADPDEVADIFKAFSKSGPGLRFLHVEVPNLWRLQAQRGLFLEAQIDPDAIWPLDRIVFPQTGAKPDIDRRRIYPDRKSHLEQMIDQHLLLKKREETVRQFLAGGNFIQFELEDPDDPQPLDFPAPTLRETLPSSPDERWSDMDLDTVPPTLSPEQLLAGGPEIEALVQARRQSTDLAVLDPAPRWRETTIQVALDALWTGMRPHPYTAAQIARSLAALIRFNAILGGLQVETTFKPTVAAARLMRDPIEIEMGIAGDGSTRACVTASRLRSALSAAGRALLELDEAASPGRLIAAVHEHRSKILLLFEPAALLDLFADEIVPWQVLTARNPAVYWPAHMTRLGRP